MPGRPVRPVIDRFFEQIEKTENGCWIWTGWIESNGYGRMLVKNGDKWTHVSVHRFSYEHHKGAIEGGMVIDHTCRNRACVNPDHLRVVTVKENVLCGIGLCAANAKKTHCPKGHEYTPDNIEAYRGRRRCRTCRRDDCKKRREAAKGSK